MPSISLCSSAIARTRSALRSAMAAGTIGRGLSRHPGLYGRTDRGPNPLRALAQHRPRALLLVILLRGALVDRAFGDRRQLFVGGFFLPQRLHHEPGDSPLAEHLSVSGDGAVGR